MTFERIAIPAVYLTFALLELARGTLFNKPAQTRSDAVVEAVSTVAVLGLVQPGVLLASAALLSGLLPQWAGSWSSLPILAQLALFLVLDDMSQYWWHRASHRLPWLYNLHRAHHSAEYMSVRIVYRNNVFYYALMPGLWLSGVLVYLGLGWTYVGYVTVKMLVIIAAHSDVRWDAPLYRIGWLSPLMRIVERTISTPATHSAHHGKYLADGNTHYKGNYGNLLFFWDVLFGTARITRAYPAEIGVENLPPVTAPVQLLWPLVRDAKV